MASLIKKRLCTVKIDLNYTLLYINKNLFSYLCKCSHADAFPLGRADRMGTDIMDIGVF